ncbi:MAG: L-serine ammonia-lyase, iron-sulfur-dependent, subunit alpha [Clostridia bacterium]|nr:L-serine ammonia-lyase, iron-sulfur-dependent, subunit alpha [Clostridia bacterium]MBQ2326997.1 L-serine ammonia-lyase, iron-sulfur-dependent, subunit alpha [Clostridia bacterium]MBQ5813189.1 L-serine ammonia-lyase, iron-sulfur-dependent, subunit alpha [Clostridia bacterium]
MKLPSIEAFLKGAQQNRQTLWQYILQCEFQDSGTPVDEMIRRVEGTYQVMKNAVRSGLKENGKSLSGLTGGDAFKYYERIKIGRTVLSDFNAKAIAYAIATNEQNASMGVIVAAPTAGASGILPGVIIAAQEEFGYMDDDIIHSLIIASGIGAVIATRATVSGAAGGCQAECGSAAAMAAGALTYLLGGTPHQVFNAAALALKNSLGLACDPVAGLVEVPCVKRNGVYASMAITASDMSLAGITSVIPPDEVIDAMFQIGSQLPSCLRETAEGGLAITPTGLAAKNRIFGIDDKK